MVQVLILRGKDTLPLYSVGDPTVSLRTLDCIPIRYITTYEPSLADIHAHLNRYKTFGTGLLTHLGLAP